MSEPVNIACDLLADIVLWRYPADAFADGSTLLVKDYQKAAVMVDGAVYDVLDTGIYIVGADTLPGLYRQLHLTTGHTGMIEADIWFVSTRPGPVLGWQVTEAKPLSISGNQSIIASGTVSFSIKDPLSFFKKFQPSGASYNYDNAFALIRDDFYTVLAKAIGQKQLKNEGGFTAPFDALAGFCAQYFNTNSAAQHGYHISSFTIDSMKYTAWQNVSESQSASAKDEALSIKQGCIILLFIMACVSFRFIILFHDKHEAKLKQEQQEADDLKQAQRLKMAREENGLEQYGKSAGWKYYMKKDDESGEYYRHAILYSDQDLAAIKRGEDPDPGVSLEVSYSGKAGWPESMWFEMSKEYSLKPIKKGDKSFIRMAFDSDSLALIPLDIFIGGMTSMNFLDSKPIIERLKNSHKLTIELFTEPYRDTESKVQYTFNTAGLKWWLPVN